MKHGTGRTDADRREQQRGTVDTDGGIDDGRRAGDRVIEPAPGESLIRPAERRR